MNYIEDEEFIESYDVSWDVLIESYKKKQFQIYQNSQDGSIILYRNIKGNVLFRLLTYDLLQVKLKTIRKKMKKI